MLLKKLLYYGVRGVLNKLFSLYFNNKKRFLSIFSHKSSLSNIKCEMPLMSLFYINDLYVAFNFKTVWGINFTAK